MEAFSAGTLAGAGSFRCDSCGFAIALHERDPVPGCPECGGLRFKRASLFGEGDPPPEHHDLEARPEWLEDAREALVRPGDYLAFEDDERVAARNGRIVEADVGRKAAADARPAVLQRHDAHALVYCDSDGSRILDDRSLNGVFRNGDRVELGELEDGDEIDVGRFRMFYVSLVANRTALAG